LPPQEFKSLTVVEAADLARILKKDLGLPDVSAVAAAPSAAATSAAAPAAAAPAAAEKTEFELKLESFGEQKIQVERVQMSCCPFVRRVPPRRACSALHRVRNC
jgi:large subunit ribosomal protein L7/L12